MFARLGPAAQAEERRRNTATGLASSLRLTGTGTQEPLWERMPSIDVPLLALAGTDDVRFAAHACQDGPIDAEGTGLVCPRWRPCRTSGPTGDNRALVASLARWLCSKKDPDGDQHTHDNLKASGRRQHRHQPSPVLSLKIKRMG